MANPEPERTTNKLNHSHQSATASADTLAYTGTNLELDTDAPPHGLAFNGTLILDGQDNLLIWTTDGGFWDSSFEVIGNTRIGVDNDHNPCILRIMRPAQGEAFIDGIPVPDGNCFEIRFCGPQEYTSCLNWFQALGAKASQIKKGDF